jgi:hypothetical protein
MTRRAVTLGLVGAAAIRAYGVAPAMRTRRVATSMKKRT